MTCSNGNKNVEWTSSVLPISAHWDFGKLPLTEVRRVSRTTAGPKMEIFVTNVNGWEPLTFVHKKSHLRFCVDMPREVETFSTIWLHLLRKKSPHSELFWSAFFPDFPALGPNTERYVLSPNTGKSAKNGDQNNSECGLFLRRDLHLYKQWYCGIFQK